MSLAVEGGATDLGPIIRFILKVNVSGRQRVMSAGRGEQPVFRSTLGYCQQKASILYRLLLKASSRVM